MEKISTNTRRFFIAAKVAELKMFENLAQNCDVVIAICELIHQLQRERGVSNVFIASKSNHFSIRRKEQVNSTNKAAEELTTMLHQHFLVESQVIDAHNNFRLLSVTGMALQGIENLGQLREKVLNLKITAYESTQAYCRLINHLLDIIFEAADIANDPDITKLLIALFNFIQAKEYAGQERAWGAIGFAKTHFDKQICHKLKQLQKAQTDSFDIFGNYADHNTIKHWQEFQNHDCNSELEKLRQVIGGLADGSIIDSELSEVWYDIATKRIDNMHRIEEELTVQLKSMAGQKVGNARQSLKQGKQLLDNSKVEDSDNSTLSVLFDPSISGIFADIDSESKNPGQNSANEMNSQVASHKSLYDLIKHQTNKITEIKFELEQSKKAFAEQKTINRAKLVIMQEMSVSENGAYQKLQKAAMNQSISIFEVAMKVVNPKSK